MDKDHERDRKHQQQNERQQEIVIGNVSVDEHFEESLRRAKEKEKVSTLFEIAKLLEVNNCNFFP